MVVGLKMEKYNWFYVFYNLGWFKENDFIGFMERIVVKGLFMIEVIVKCRYFGYGK